MLAERPAVVSKGRRVFVLVAALVLMAITARAGWWQLDRAAQKLALQSSIEGRAGLPPLSAAELAVGAREAEAQWHRPAAVQGEWVGEHSTVFLDNRQMGGRPGFFVLSALRLPGGAAVLVQRGWVPRDAQDRNRLPSVPLPARPGAHPGSGGPLAVAAGGTGRAAGGSDPTESRRGGVCRRHRHPLAAAVAGADGGRSGGPTACNANGRNRRSTFTSITATPRSGSPSAP